MHFHLPKPLHGWREFVGEVGIIVIGVLIALGAEQIVETLHWRHEVKDFRAALQSEIAHNIGTYDYRKLQDPCVNKRLDELQAWLESWRKGNPLVLHGSIGIPLSLSVFNSVWMSRNVEIESHMPLSDQLAYSRLYDRFANNEVHRLAERDVWLQLKDYDGANRLDEHDLLRLQGLIGQARYREATFDLNAANYTKQAFAMGIRPTSDPSWPKFGDDLCHSILGDGTKSKSNGEE